MNFKERYNLWKIKRFASPSRVFKNKLQKKLEQVWNDKYVTKIYWFQTKIFKFIIVSIIVLLLVGSFGTGVYAYYSPEVIEGSMLYPIKNTIEKIEEKIKYTPEARKTFYLKQLKRRELEKKKLEEKKKEIDNLEAQIKKIEEKLEKIDIKLQNKTLDGENLEFRTKQPQLEDNKGLEEKHQFNFESKKQEIQQSQKKGEYRLQNNK